MCAEHLSSTQILQHCADVSDCRNNATIQCSQQQSSATAQAEQRGHAQKIQTKGAWGTNDSTEEMLLFLAWKDVGEEIERLGMEIPASRSTRGYMARQKVMIGQEDQTIEELSAADANFQ